jgi:hypothetical protein
MIIFHLSMITRERLLFIFGSEYDNKPFNDFLTEKGIKGEFIVPYSHESNGVSE